MMISTTPPSLVDLIPAGVVTGDNLCLLYSLARKHGCAIPAFTCHRYGSKKKSAQSHTALLLTIPCPALTHFVTVWIRVKQSSERPAYLAPRW